MTIRTASLGISLFGQWLRQLSGQSVPRRRKVRTSGTLQLQPETLESREVLTAHALSSLVRVAADLGAPSHVQDVLSHSTTPAPSSSGAPSRVAQVIQVAALVNDPNDQISEAINMGATGSAHTELGTIDSPTDVDMFGFTVTAGERVFFDIDSPDRRLDSVIRLFDSTGRQLALNDDGAAPGESASYESFLDYTFASGGRYYIGVSGYGNSSYNAVTGTGDTNGRTGDYSLTVTSNDPPPVRFDTESNNTISTANFIGVFPPGFYSQTYYGSTGTSPDTQDWIRIRLAGRTSGTIQLSPVTQDLDLELYNANGSRIASSINSGIRVDTINMNGLAAGTYYVHIMPGVSGARGAYALRFGMTVS